MASIRAELQTLKRMLPSQPATLAAVRPIDMAARIGLALDSWQADLLASGASQQILLCSRQAGKSTVSAVQAIHEAIYRPPALVLLLAPALRQAQELFRKVMEAYNSLGRPVAAVQESALSIEFGNGSRIVCLPGKEATIRGFSGVTLLIVDEAARAPDELYYALRPMLAVSGGRLILLSTPWGRRGFFHHEWAEGGPDWQRAKVTAYDVPRIDREWLERERQSIPRHVFDSEYMCAFGETLDSVFSHEDIQAAFDPDLEPLFTTPHFGRKEAV